MATEEQIIEEQNFVTDRISTQVRGIALSMIAVAWLFLTGEATQFIQAAKPLGSWLVACLLLSLLALLLDYAQYVAGYRAIAATLRGGSVEGRGYVYNYDSVAYKLRVRLFFWKQVVLIAAVAAFVYALLRAAI